MNQLLQDLLLPETHLQGVMTDRILDEAEGKEVVKIKSHEKVSECLAVLSKEAIDFVSKNTEAFSSYEKSAMPDDYCSRELSVVRKQFINMDAPDHGSYRRLITPYITDSHLQKLRLNIEEITRKYIMNYISRGGGNFIEYVAKPVPIEVIVQFLGIQVDDVNHVGDLIESLLYTDGEATSSELFLYVLNKIENNQGVREGSLISEIMSREINGRPLTLEDSIAYVSFLLVAGTSSTQASLGHCMRLMIEYRDQYKELICRPELIDSAVEEILRYSPAFLCMRRTCVKPIKYKNVRIGPGTKIILFYPTANRCTRTFGSDSSQFNILRFHNAPSASNQHRTFGIGEHFCLGNQLAKLEMHVLLREMISQIKEPVVSADIEYFRSNHLSSIKRLELMLQK